MIAFAGMVVDDIEEDLDPSPMQGVHHGFELHHLLPDDPRAGIADLGRKEAQGTVPPVIDSPLLHEMMLVEKLMHREQFQGGHAELVEIVQQGGVGEASVGAAPLGGDLGMAGRHAFHVQLIDEGVGPRGPGWAVLLPGKARVDHDTFREIRRAITPVPVEVRVGISPEG